MQKFKYRLRVRYAETDQMGFVYYANYFVYFEAARSEFMRSIGLSYKNLEKQGIFLPVVEAYAKYISPTFYEDEIEIELWLNDIKSASLTLNYNVQRVADNKLLAKGWTKHAILNKERAIIKNGKITEHIKEKMGIYIE